MVNLTIMLDCTMAELYTYPSMNLFTNDMLMFFGYANPNKQENITSSHRIKDFSSKPGICSCHRVIVELTSLLEEVNHILSHISYCQDKDSLLKSAK